MRGKFITLEGSEGSGKSTNLAYIRERLLEQGVELVVTREPGGTALGEAIRGLLLDHRNTAMSSDTELLLMFAARAQHVRRIIRPALQRGAFVVSDRFTDSSYAYQGAGRGLDPAWIEALERRAVGIRPGLTLLLDLDVREGRARTSGRDLWPDRIESEQDDFFERVRVGFRQRAAAEPQRFRLIDASRSPAEVGEAVTRALTDWLGQLR